MKTEAGDPSLAHKTARWILLLPLSLACGAGVGLGSRAVLSLLAFKPASEGSLYAEGLAAAFAAVAFLSTANSLAPFWKRGVVIAFSGALLLLNVFQALLPAWSLARHGASSLERTDLAQVTGFASVAAVVLAFSIRRAAGQSAHE